VTLEMSGACQSKGTGKGTARYCTLVGKVVSHEDMGPRF
jgi:hypothetical protein